MCKITVVQKTCQHKSASVFPPPPQLCAQEKAAGEPAAAAVAEGQAVLRYEYHVLYSCSYQIPVLYFRASTLGTVRARSLHRPRR